METFTGGDDVEPYGFDVVRTTIDISKAGKGRLKLEKASHTPRDEFAGTRVYVPISSGPDIYVKPEGMGKIVFNYYTGSSLRSPLFFGRNDEYKSGDSKQLFFVVKQGRDGARGIVSMVPDTAKLPMKIACDTRTFNSIVLDAEWVFAENSNEQATLSCHVLRKSGRFVVECRWSPKNKAKFIDIAKKEGIVLDQPFELEFEIPQSPVLSEKCRFGFGRYLHLGSRLPPEKSKLGYSRFEVSGQLFLRFGYGLEQDGERFEFTPKEVADQALWGIRNPRWGVESGDWLLSINGKTPETLSEANKMIDDLPFSERIELEIENDRGIKKVLLMDTNPMR